jgi:ABC-type polysaccharide/polyol phosphate export permease
MMLADVKEMLAEQVHYRELLWQMTVRDIRLRYKQTVMGFGWAIFMPLLNTAVFSVIFTRVAPINVGVPYPLFAYCGLMVWNFFSSALRFSVVSLTSNPNLVSKVFFPREIFPFSAIIVCLLDFAVASLVLVALMIYYHVPPSAQIAWLPLVLVVHVAFTAGVALLLSMGNLFYRDVKYIFELVVTVWMFATSVLYPSRMIGGKLGLVIQYNPLTPIIDGYRAALIGTPMPDPASFAYSALLSALLFVGAWVVFHRSEFEFAESL